MEPYCSRFTYSTRPQECYRVAILCAATSPCGVADGPLTPFARRGPYHLVAPQSSDDGSRIDKSPDEIRGRMTVFPCLQEETTAIRSRRSDQRSGDDISPNIPFTANSLE